MGTVFRKRVTKPLPAGAEIVTRKTRQRTERHARWKNAKGKSCSAPVQPGNDGTDRIVIIAETYTAQYRDANNVKQEIPTGCRTEEAARAILSQLMERADRVKSGLRTRAEDAVVDYQALPLRSHIEAFIAHQTAKQVSKVRIANTRSQLKRVTEDCGWKSLADLDGNSLERWLTARQVENMGAATRNG